MILVVAWFMRGAMCCAMIMLELVVLCLPRLRSIDFNYLN
jgi:hypothetical protein